MESGIIILSMEQRKNIQPKIRKYRMEFDQLKRSFHKANENFENQRNKEKLMGEVDEESKETETRLLNHQDKLRAQNDLLLNATKTIYETDKISFEIMDGLDRQNTVAGKARGKIKDIFTYLGDSNSIISRMLKREKLNKIADRKSVV